MAAEQVDIAAAPAMRSANVVKTVEELENEINNSSYTINQVSFIHSCLGLKSLLKLSLDAIGVRPRFGSLSSHF